MLIDIWNHGGFWSPRAGRTVAAALALSYPLLAHVASLFGNPALTIASVVVLAAAILFRPLSEGRRWAWFALPPVAVAIVGLWRNNAAALVLFLPPILLNVFLAWLFGHTLARRHTPLIERLVRLLQPPGVPFERGVIGYARQVTRLWTGLFLLLGTASLALAALATPGGLLEVMGIPAPAAVRIETWSLFTNILNYLLVAAVFLIEFAYRRWRFPRRPYRNLVDFFRRSAAVAPALAATFGRDTGATETVTESDFTVPAEHPVFAGHFPERPVFPAVMLLDAVIESAGASLGVPVAVAGLPRAKFMAPLAPGDRAKIRLKLRADRLKFEVIRGSERVAQGVLRLHGTGHPRDR